jgi:hypothetical protein
MESIQEEPVVVGLMPRCIDDCLACHRLCLETAVHLLEEGRRAKPPLVLQLWDCAEICSMTVDISLRGSALAGRSWENCADVCEACARKCASFTEDARLQACAETCRRCVASCRDMADLQRNHAVSV